MTLTEQYTLTHAAFGTAGARDGLTRYEVRVLVAVAESGRGRIATDALAIALGNEGSATRRALADLYRSGHLVGVGEDGRPRRPGVQTVVSLTVTGRAVASAAMSAVIRELTVAA